MFLSVGKMARLARPQSKYELIKQELTLPCREIDRYSFVFIVLLQQRIDWKLADILNLY
jgi:hypothetical protein